MPVRAGEGARELAVLNAIATALNSSVDVHQALARTLALVADLLGLRTGWVWLLDPETDQFYLAAAQNLPPYLQEPVRMSGRWCLLHRSLSPGRVDADQRRHARVQPPPLRRSRSTPRKKRSGCATTPASHSPFRSAGSASSTSPPRPGGS